MRITSIRPYLAVLATVVALILVTGDGLRGQAGERERTLFVSAVDKDGEPIADLGLSDFVVTEDGRRREVLRVSRAVEPMDIALLVDNSAAAENTTLPMREGLTNFVSRMAEGNQIALVALASRPTILTDYTSDVKRLTNGIGLVWPQRQSGTTLLDAIVETSKGLGRRESTRAALVAVVTNGVEYSKWFSPEVVDAMTRASVSLHAITLGASDDLSSEEGRQRARVLNSAAPASGGQRIVILADTGINAALQKVARQLSAQYKVVYNRPESFLPPEKTEVSAARPGITMRGTPARGQTGA
jgi:VWFA-related protein